MATIPGTNNSERLNGTESADVVDALGGDDSIYGYGGNDTLNGGTGNDIFYIGGSSSGRDIFNGGDGDDTIYLYADIVVSNLQFTTANVSNIEGLNFSFYDISGTGGSDKFDLSGISSFISPSAIYMYDGNDSYIGQFGIDTVFGGSGNDTLSGGAGADYLYGDAGNDRLLGGSGDDTIYISGTDHGYDIFDGGTGSDRIQLSGDIVSSNFQLIPGNVSNIELLDFSFYDIVGTGANDLINLSGISQVSSPSYVYLYDGNDRYTGHAQNDTVVGGDGNDTLVGITGDDVFYGESGADQMYGSSGDDTFYISGSDFGYDRFDGGTGSDTIQLNGDITASRLYLTSANVIAVESLNFSFYDLLGTGGNDVFDLKGIKDVVSESWIAMGDGRDLVHGTQGSDLIDGGGGNDSLMGGLGDDELYGGTGIDTAVYTQAVGGVRVNLGITSSQSVGGGQGWDKLELMENVLGSAYNDRIYGDAVANSLTGNNGNDLLSGRDGNDVLAGNNGNDTLAGGRGNDVLAGNAGIDTADYSTANGTVYVSLAVTGRQTIGADQGSDRLSAIENIIGSNHGDRLQGNSVNNTLDGGAGADTIIGAGGNDTLLGGARNDQLIGASGGDLLRGDAGNDLLLGGGGADRFEFSVTSGSDRINDWDDGFDRMLINEAVYQGRLYDDYSDLTIRNSGAGAVVSFGAATVTLAGVSAGMLDSSDFVFV